METKTDQSFGIVPLSTTPSGVEVLLIHQINRHGGTFWGFPKGHPEAGEEGVATALRELKEETGLIPTEVIAERPFLEEYTFNEGDVVVHKTVSYFLAWCAVTAFSVQSGEVKEARWCSFEEARTLLTHDNNKALLNEVAAHLAAR